LYLIYYNAILFIYCIDNLQYNRQMDATLNTNTISQSNTQVITPIEENNQVRKQKGSLEFLSGVFFLVKKVFLLG